MSDFEKVARTSPRLGASFEALGRKGSGASRYVSIGIVTASNSVDEAFTRRLRGVDEALISLGL